MAHFRLSVPTRLALVMAILVAWSSSGVTSRSARGGYSAGRGMHGLALRKELPEQALRRRVPQARKQLEFNPVPLFVMLPLDTVSPSTRRLADPEGLFESLVELKRAGCEGVMGDVWWGIVEAEGPNEYDWTGYAQLIEMVASVGLKFQAVMSFHQCGGNVGDGCSIPLPEVLSPAAPLAPRYLSCNAPTARSLLLQRGPPAGFRPYRRHLLLTAWPICQIAVSVVLNPRVRAFPRETNF